MKRIALFGILAIGFNLLLTNDNLNRNRNGDCVKEIEEGEGLYGGIVECSKYSSKKLTSKIVVCKEKSDKSIYFCPETDKWVLRGVVDETLDKDLEKSAEMVCGCRD